MTKHLKNSLQSFCHQPPYGAKYINPTSADQYVTSVLIANCRYRMLYTLNHRVSKLPLWHYMYPPILVHLESPSRCHQQSLGAHLHSSGICKEHKDCIQGVETSKDSNLFRSPCMQEMYSTSTTVATVHIETCVSDRRWHGTTPIIYWANYSRLRIYNELNKI